MLDKLIAGDAPAHHKAILDPRGYVKERGDAGEIDEPVFHRPVKVGSSSDLLVKLTIGSKSFEATAQTRKQAEADAATAAIAALHL